MDFARAIRTFFLISWVAIATWFSFLQAPLLFRAFPNLASEVQIALFPLYWGTGYFLLGTTAFFYLVKGLAKLRSSELLRSAILLVVISFIIINQLWLMPKIEELRDVMRSASEFPRSEVESTGEQFDAAAQENSRKVAIARNDFGFWHGASLLLNFISLVVVLLYAVIELLHRPRQSRFG